jgi:hypothetical protein
MKFLRAYLPLALLVLAVAARAADLRATPQVSVPPLLLGPASQAAPLWRALDARVSGPAEAALALPPSAPALDVLSARVLARAAAEPAAARALLAAHPDPAAAARLAAAVEALRPGVSAHAELVEAAKADPAAAALFDGGSAKPSLELDGLVMKGRKITQDKQKLQFLGAGEFGAVYVHPKVDGAIIKAVEHGFEVALFGGQSITQTANEEEQTSRALAAADAGPRYFGRAVVGGRELSVRERVFGDTMQSLAWDRKFGVEERGLVLDLLRRMAKAGLLTDDKRAPNIMIGRTLLDPRRRAYLIDGGHVLPVEAGLSEDALFERLLHQNTIIVRRFDPHMGEVEISKPFSQIVDEAVRRATKTSFLDRLKEIGRAILAGPNAGR